MPAQRLSGHRSEPGNNVEHALRHAGFGGQLGELESRKTRQFGRLQDNRVARGERRGDLPRGDDEGVVPRHDRTHHAEWFAGDQGEGSLQSGRDFVVDLVEGLGIPTHGACGLRHVDPAGIPDGMSGIDRFQQGQFVKVLQHQLTQPNEHPGTLPWIGPRPDAGAEGAGRSPKGVVNIRFAGGTHRAEQLAIARREAVEGGAIASRPKITIDEQPGFRRESGGHGNPIGHTVYLFTAVQSICAPSPGRVGTTKSPAASMSSGVRKKSRRSGVQPGGS